MAYFPDDDVYPVTRITTGAVGEPGKRIFILQAYVGGEPISWVIEKEQASALSKMIPRLLAQVRTEYPELSDPLVAARPNLDLGEPLEPEFRVGNIALDYDRLHDLVVFTLSEANGEEAAEDELEELEVGDGDEEEPSDLQLYATRGQALLLSRQAELVVSAGRPACPNCGEPIDDFGHFCLSPMARTKWNSDYLQ
jgi:uncharacterized repeat protein (TIGR03847 family)